MAYSPSPDSDGDGIPNDWETNGIPYNGTNGVLQHYKLHEGNPHRTHLYVEVDYMKEHKPIGLGNVTNAFKNAPVGNPDTTKGINLKPEIDEEIPHEDTTSMEDLFAKIRPQWFGTAAERADPNHDAMLAAKSIVYHYDVFAHDQPGTSSGSSGLGQQPGMNSFVTLGACPDPRGFCWPKDPNTGHAVGSWDQQEGTFMHELGHNLNLTHGGNMESDGKVPPTYFAVNCKPNYLSVMNYLFQSSNPVSDRPLDYSKKTLNDLTKTSLNQPTGLMESDPPNLKTVYGPRLQGKPVAFAFANGSALDWNQNGIKTDTGVNADINSGVGTCGTGQVGNLLRGFNDWSNIKYITQIYSQKQQAGSQQQGVASGSPGQNLAPAPEKELKIDDIMRSNLLLLEGVKGGIGQIKSGQTSGQVNTIKQTVFEVQNLIGVLKKQQPSAPSPTAATATAPTTMPTTAPGSAAIPTTTTTSSLPPEVAALMQKPTGGMSVDTNHVEQSIKTGELGTAIGELDKLLAEVSTLNSSLSQPQQQPQQQQQQQQQQPQQSPTSQTPIANAGVSQTVEANATVMLDGRSSQPAKPGTSITAYQWTQLPAPGAVPVNLIGGPNIPTPMFIAPTLPYDTTLSFGLRVLASDGSVSTNDAVVHVMVKRYAGPMTTGGGGGGAPGAFQQPPSSQSQLQQPQQPLQQQQPMLPPQQQQPPPQQQSPGMRQQQHPLSPNLQQQPNLPSRITP